MGARVRGRRVAAITGTPGTGKSTVARLLGPGRGAVEVGDLALGARVARRRGRSIELDLRRLGDWIRHHRTQAPPLLVGHLAHLLPVRDVVVLRCDPRVLERRLARARRGTPTTRRANAIAEATDAILLEALGRRQRVWEVDTTRRSPGRVARDVREVLSRRPPPRYGAVRWLEEPGVTEHLLRPVPYAGRWSRRGTAVGSPRTSTGSPRRSSRGRRTG